VLPESSGLPMKLKINDIVCDIPQGTEQKLIEEFWQHFVIGQYSKMNDVVRAGIKVLTRRILSEE